jgi:hypothetical protein
MAFTVLHAAWLCGLVVQPHLHGTARHSRSCVRCSTSDEGLAPVIDPLRTLDTIVTRALDTVEDAFLMARRSPAKVVDSKDSLKAWQDPADARPRVLIVGSGWAAHALVKAIDADLCRLLVVSPRNYFVFTPMLAAASVGTVEYVQGLQRFARCACASIAFVTNPVQP